jgi:hypothetical protein
MDSGNLMNDIQNVLLLGSQQLKLVNEKMEKIDVDDLLDDLKESVNNINEKSDIISDFNMDDTLGTDTEIEKELNMLIHVSQSDTPVVANDTPSSLLSLDNIKTFNTEIKDKKSKKIKYQLDEEIIL